MGVSRGPLAIEGARHMRELWAECGLRVTEDD